MSNEGTEIIFGASAMIHAEVDVQIATAHRFPRVLERFNKNVDLAVKSSVEAAGSMSYMLERESTNRDTNEKEKKEIIGPSIRFAEVIAPAYGNMRVAARILEIDDYFVTTQGAAWDLESNFAQAFERKASIRTSKGHKYGQDMIKTASNASQASSRREAIIKTIPRALWYPHYEAARQYVADQTGETLRKNIQAALDYFAKKGVALEQVLKKLGKSEISALTGEDLLVLRAAYTSIHDEGKDAREMFATEEDKQAESSSSRVAEQLKARKDREQPAEEKPAADREIEA